MAAMIWSRVRSAVSTSRAPGGQSARTSAGTRLPAYRHTEHCDSRRWARTVIRSAAPGPAPTKWTVTGAPDSGPAPDSGRGSCGRTTGRRGSAGRQVVKVPRSPARSRPIRVRAPPRRSRQPARALCPSIVTALATSRPPAASASQQAGTTPSAVTPPPMNTASGRGSPASASGAEPATTTRPGTPSAAALRAMRSRRSARGSTAMARLAGWTRIHSMPTLPEPAPTSHSSWPGTGARAASASARISRLVICPSCSNASSGRPGTRGSGAAPASRRQLDRDDGQPAVRPPVGRARPPPARCRGRRAR